MATRIALARIQHRCVPRAAGAATGCIRLLALALTGLLTFAALLDGSVQAQDFPVRPVRMIVPSTPGSGPDVLARTLSQKLSERWGQPVVVENRPGATGIIGADQVVKAAPDGYTLLVVANSYATNPALYKSMPFDAIKDLAPVAQIAVGGMVLVVHPSLPVKTVQDLIALAKAQPGMPYGSAGQGSTHHMMMELFGHAAGVSLQHVPYKGPGPITGDVLSGQIKLAFITVATALPHINAGKLRALAVAGERRFAVAPDIPTVAEAGLKGVEPNLWYGMLAPAATPPNIIRKINSDVATALNLADVRESLLKQGIEPAPSSPEALGEIIRTDVARYIKLVQDVGIKAE